MASETEAARKKRLKEEEAARNAIKTSDDVMALMRKVDKGLGGKEVALEEKKLEDFLSTGLLSLDLIMGGGYYGGQVFQYFGKSHTGKCLTKDTILSTEMGLLTIEEIFNRSGKPCACTRKEVDFSMGLVNRYGEVESCSKLFMNGPRKVWEIVTDSGASIESTAGHPHLVMSESGNWVWRKTQDIKPGDYLIRPFNLPFGE